MCPRYVYVGVVEATKTWLKSKCYHQSWQHSFNLPHWSLWSLSTKREGALKGSGAVKPAAIARASVIQIQKWLRPSAAVFGATGIFGSLTPVASKSPGIGWTWAESGKHQAGFLQWYPCPPMVHWFIVIFPFKGPWIPLKLANEC